MGKYILRPLGRMQRMICPRFAMPAPRIRITEYQGDLPLPIKYLEVEMATSLFVYMVTPGKMQ